MQLLIHTLNNSLFPSADVDSITTPSTDPPLAIVAVQAILYASLATSLLAAFLATLGKQWVNRYTRSKGGSVIEKSQDRQKKLNAFNDWSFHLLIESLPVMLQLALLLFCCAVSIYLWTINHTVARVAVAFTLIGILLYTIFSIAAILSPTCPYQTPFSIGIRGLVRGISTLYHSVRSMAAPWGIKRPNFITRYGNRSTPGDEENPQYHSVKLDDYYFGEMTARPGECLDAHCVSWVLGSATDDDVVLYSARFAVEMTLHPEMASIFSPVVLGNHLLSSAMGRRGVSTRSEQTSMIGMALASVLSIQFCMDPEREDLSGLSRDLCHYIDWISSSEPTVSPGVAILGIVLKNRGESAEGWEILSTIPDSLPTSQKLCLSRIILQTVWRRRWSDPRAIFYLEPIDAFFDRSMANGDHAIQALKTNRFLIMAISLGASAGSVRELFAPDTRCVVLLSFLSTRLTER